jgi:processive 1,2-diacylglycerol beta-glucosyltransferase
VLLLVVVYDRIADLTRVDVTGAVARGRTLLRVEGLLHLGVEHTLVAAVAGHRLLSQVLSLYYDWAHLSVAIAVGVWLYLRRPDVYRGARTALLGINAAAFAVFVVWPVAPPRLVPGDGVVDVVARSGTWGSWSQIGAVAQHSAQYGAFPSLHIAWALWVLIVVRAASDRALPRRLAALHLAATVAVVLSTGNHYVIDVAAGAALGVVAWALATRSAAPAAGGVLVVTASMGAGHDGVAYELARRWEQQGMPTRVVDFLEVMPLRTGHVIRQVYSAQLHHAPRTYEWLYGALDRYRSLDRIAGFIAGWARGRLLRMARRGDHHLVVSTYPLAGRALGRLRREGRLAVPAVTFLTDVDVHSTWLDKGTDLYLAVYGGSAVEASRRTGRPSLATGPVLAPHHDQVLTEHERAAARKGLGLTEEHRPVALIVTGSWGVGDVAATARSLCRGEILPVVLCGRNEALRRELEAEGIRAIGWTDDVRTLYAAADVVVHNAGGLSSLEAMAAGVPVVGHACLPGHGGRNARAMADAGVAAYATDGADLVRIVHELATEAGREQAARARALFATDPVDVLTDVRPLAPAKQATRPVRRVAAIAASLTAAFALSNAGMSEASERGLGVARAPESAAQVFVAVQLDASSLANPRTPSLLARAGVSALVEPAVAAADPRGAHALVVAGVRVLADFPVLPSLPGRGRGLCLKALADTSAAVGAPVTALVSVHGLGTWPLVAAHLDHLEPGVAQSLSSPATARLHEGEQVVLAVPDTELPAALASLARTAHQDGLELLPLAALWDKT